MLAAFARLADEGTLEELGQLFAEDVEWSMKILAIGAYRDELVQEPGGWVIARREVRA